MHTHDSTAARDAKGRSGEGSVAPLVDLRDLGSLLQRAGFKHVINVIGGFDAWQQEELPSVSAKPAGV